MPLHITSEEPFVCDTQAPVASLYALILQVQYDTRAA